MVTLQFMGSATSSTSMSQVYLGQLRLQTAEFNLPVTSRLDALDAAKMSMELLCLKLPPAPRTTSLAKSFILQ